MRVRAPRVTVTVFAVTTFLTTLQVAGVSLSPLLQRTPDVLARHEEWRLVTPLFVNRGGWLEIALNLASLALVGALAEPVLGGRAWLVAYLSGGIAGELAGLAWKPWGSGSSVAVLGLLGALVAFLAFDGKTKPARVAAFLVLMAGLALTALRNLHGPPILIGLCAGGVWAVQSRAYQRRVSASRPPPTSPPA